MGDHVHEGDTTVYNIRLMWPSLKGVVEMSARLVTRCKRATAAFCATALASVAIAAPASAQQQQQNGLVNVAIGDITIQDVNVGVAALVAAQVCGVQVGPVVVLATRVDATSQQRTVCELETGDVVLTQA
jgi:hypothetical protein